MNKFVMFFIVLLLCFFSVLIFAQSSPTNNQINWNTNLDFAKSVAKQYNRPLFIFFQDVPPNSITTSVYNSSLSNAIIVEKVNGSFVPVRVQGDTLLQNMYNITRFPTLLILDPNGVELDRVAGVMSADTIFSMLEDVLNASSSASSSTATTAESSQQKSIAIVYQYDGGRFIHLEGNKNMKWIHDSGYYTIIYTSYHEDKVFYYIRNKKLDVKLAIPKSIAQSVWVWKEDKWISLNDTVSVIDVIKLENLDKDIRTYVESAQMTKEERTNR